MGVLNFLALQCVKFNSVPIDIVDSQNRRNQQRQSEEQEDGGSIQNNNTTTLPADYKNNR